MLTPLSSVHKTNAAACVDVCYMQLNWLARWQTRLPSGRSQQTSWNFIVVNLLALTSPLQEPQLCPVPVSLLIILHAGERRRNEKTRLLVCNLHKSLKTAMKIQKLETVLEVHWWKWIALKQPVVLSMFWYVALLRYVCWLQHCRYYFSLYFIYYEPSVCWHCWLGGRKGIRPVKNWASAGVVVCLERGADLHVPSWCHCHSPSLASVKSRLVLPFWYRLTRVVRDKGPLNGCVFKYYFYFKCILWHLGLPIFVKHLLKCITTKSQY